MKRRAPGLTTKILIGLFLGGLIGWLWPETGQSLKPLATIFIRLVMMILAPLVFAGLVVGIADAAARARVSGMAVKAFAFYTVVTGFALALGMSLAWLLQPGAGVSGAAAAPEALRTVSGEPFWLRLFPSSAFDAMARNDVLQIVLLSLLFAIAVGRSGEKGKPVVNVCRSLLDVMFKLTDIVMLVAPIGVLGAAAAMVGEHGLRIGENLLRLVLTVYLGLGILLVIFPLLAWSHRIPLGGLFRATRDPFTIAFATTTGAAAYPLAVENLEAFGVPRQVATFVVFTVHFNYAGSSVFIGAASVFLIQAFQIQVAASDVLTLFAILFLATKAVGPVPRGSLVALAAGLTSFGVPPETVALGFGLLLGVDPIMDMARTGVNMANNCLSACLVARWQGNFQTRAGRAQAEMPASSL